MKKRGEDSALNSKRSRERLRAGSAQIAQTQELLQALDADEETSTVARQNQSASRMHRVAEWVHPIMSQSEQEKNHALLLDFFLHANFPFNAVEDPFLNAS